MLDPKLFFKVAATVADAAAVNPNGTKILLDDGVGTIFINGKPAVINGLRKLRKVPSWLVTFLVVSFNKIPLFSKTQLLLQCLLSHCLLALLLNMQLMKVYF